MGLLKMSRAAAATEPGWLVDVALHHVVISALNERAMTGARGVNHLKSSFSSSQQPFDRLLLVHFTLYTPKRLRSCLPSRNPRHPRDSHAAKPTSSPTRPQIEQTLASRSRRPPPPLHSTSVQLYLLSTQHAYTMRCPSPLGPFLAVLALAPLASTSSHPPRVNLSRPNRLTKVTRVPHGVTGDHVERDEGSDLALRDGDEMHSLSKRGSFSGRATFFSVGLGACGAISSDDDFVSCTFFAVGHGRRGSR